MPDKIVPHTDMEDSSDSNKPGIVNRRTFFVICLAIIIIIASFGYIFYQMRISPYTPEEALDKYFEKINEGNSHEIINCTIGKFYNQSNYLACVDYLNNMSYPRYVEYYIVEIFDKDEMTPQITSQCEVLLEKASNNISYPITDYCGIHYHAVRDKNGTLFTEDKALICFEINERWYFYDVRDQ